MRTYRFFIEKPHLSIGETLKMEDGLAHHMVNVLKLKIGQSIMLFNDTNMAHLAMILKITRHSVSVQIKQIYEENRESSLNIHLVQSISKGERMDFTLQKSVELGVHEITPIFSERSEVRIKGDRIDSKMAHWRKVIISACEQCGRNRLPVLNYPVPFVEWIGKNPIKLGILANPKASQSIHDLSIPDSVTLMIGPEGGFGLSEVNMAIQSHFVPVRVGPRILRTETAAMTIITVLQFQAGDL